MLYLLATCDSDCLVQLSKQPRCPKVLNEGAKGVFGPPGWDSQNSLLHGAKPLFGHFPPVRNRVWTVRDQQVLNLTPLNPTPTTCHKRKRKLHCSFRSAALQELHSNIVFSAVRKSFGPKAALQQTKNCTATSKKLRCRKVALSCRFPAAFKPPRLGTHVSDLLTRDSFGTLGWKAPNDF